MEKETVTSDGIKKKEKKKVILSKKFSSNFLLFSSMEYNVEESLVRCRYVISCVVSTCMDNFNIVLL